MTKIYFLHAEDDLTPKYVGSTKQELRIRRENHLSDPRWNHAKAKWINGLKRQGKTIYIKLLEECSDDIRYERESFYTNIFKETVFNIKEGVSHTNEWKRNASKRRKGKPLSEKTRAKMQEFQMQKARAVVINSEVFISINLASRQTGISAGFICSCCQGKKRSKKHQISYK